MVPKLLKSSSALFSFCSGLFLLFSLIALDDVCAQRRRTSVRNTRTRTVTTFRPRGVNMCKIQQVVGTNKKFFTNCVAKHLKNICGRPTFERWHCCPGFFKIGRELGCSGEQALVNIFNTSLKVDLINFHTVTSRTNMAEELSNHGAYTVFAPSNEAMTTATGALSQQLRQKDGKLIRYHVIPGRLNMTSFRGKNVPFETLLDGKTFWINKYPYGVSTVNCARVIRPDALATNGIIHVIDKVLNPADMEMTLADRIFSDRRFKLFQQALTISGLVRKLKRRKSAFTVMTPTDRAFNKISRETKRRILTDPKTAEKVVRRHIVKGVYCADAIVVSVALRTLEKTRILFRCKRDGMHVNEGKLVDRDLVGKNGVLHAIDTVLLPDSVKTLGELLDDMHLNRFHKLFREAGMNTTVDCGDVNITLFTPTDYAVGQLPSSYLSRLRRDKSDLRKMMNYHIVPGRVPHDALVGDTTLKTKANSDVKIKVNVYRNGIRLDKALLRKYPRQCENVLIHKLDRVLIPPEESFMDLLMKDRSYRIFAELLNKTRQTWSPDPFGSYTLLAPSNRAFSFLDPKDLKRIYDNPTRLRRFVQRHFINRMVLRATIPKRGSYGIESMQGDETEFSYNHVRSLVVNTHARIISEDLMASNGVMYKIDHVIPCSCEKRLKTVRGQYINSGSYRRVY